MHFSRNFLTALLLCLLCARQLVHGSCPPGGYSLTAIKELEPGHCFYVGDAIGSVSAMGSSCLQFNLKTVQPETLVEHGFIVAQLQAWGLLEEYWIGAELHAGKWYWVDQYGSYQREITDLRFTTVDNSRTDNMRYAYAVSDGSWVQTTPNAQKIQACEVGDPESTTTAHNADTTDANDVTTTDANDVATSAANDVTTADSQSEDLMSGFYIHSHALPNSAHQKIDVFWARSCVACAAHCEMTTECDVITFDVTDNTCALYAITGSGVPIGTDVTKKIFSRVETR